jgi:hypothetical protein
MKMRAILLATVAGVLLTGNVVAHADWRKTTVTTADGEYTRGLGVHGSKSKPYGVFGRDADQRNRDASGAGDVVASDRDGNHRPKVYAIPTNLQPDEEVMWTYDIIVLQSDGGSGQLYVQKTPYGMFASERECKLERTIKVAAMEAQRDTDGKINNLPVTQPITKWRAVTPPTILTDGYSNSDYRYDYGYGRRAGGSTGSDGSGSWGSSSGAGATATQTSRAGTTQRVVRGESQAMLPGDCVPKVVVKTMEPPKPAPVPTEPDELDLPPPPMMPRR